MDWNLTSTNRVADYTKVSRAQIEAGAQAVMVFDSWGGVLADGAFQTFSLAYTQRVLRQLKRSHAGVDIPRIVFTKGGGLWLEQMAALECEVLGLDWTVNLGKARALVGGAVGGPGKALQGNIDPNILFAPPAQIATEVRRVLVDEAGAETALPFAAVLDDAATDEIESVELSASDWHLPSHAIAALRSLLRRAHVLCT